MTHDDTTGTYVELPTSLKLMMKDDDRTIKDILISGAEAELGVTAEDSIAVLRRKKRRKETRKRELEEEKDELETQIARYETDIARIEDAIETRQAKQQSYESMLDAVLNKMENGEIQHFIAELSEARELRTTHNRDFGEIRHDLKQRAARQERAIYNTQFLEKQEAERFRRQSETNECLIAECVDRDVVDEDGGDGDGQ